MPQATFYIYYQSWDGSFCSKSKHICWALFSSWQNDNIFVCFASIDRDKNPSLSLVSITFCVAHVVWTGVRLTNQRALFQALTNERQRQCLRVLKWQYIISRGTGGTTYTNEHCHYNQKSPRWLWARNIILTTKICFRFSLMHLHLSSV